MSLQDILKQRLITDAAGLVGRKILAAHKEGCPETLYLRLDEDRFCMITVQLWHGESFDLVFKHEVDAYQDFKSLVKIGTMTDTALRNYEKTKEDIRVKQRLLKDRVEYEKLKKIFDSPIG